MPDPSDAYVRVYYSIRSDDRFADVYSDDHHLAAWLRLLLDADAVWPAPASIPAHCRKASLTALVKSGLVELLPHLHFRVHGLDAERERRARAGRVGGLASGRSRSVERPLNDRSDGVGTIVEPKPNLDAQSRAETSRDAQDADPVAVYYALTIRPPNEASTAWLDELTEKHGLEAVCRQLAVSWAEKREIKSFLGRVSAALTLSSRQAERRELAEEKTRTAAKRRPVSIVPKDPPPISPEEIERQIAEYKASLGGVT